MFATVLSGLSVFFLTRFLYTTYVKPDKLENRYADLALGIGLGSIAVIIHLASKKEAKANEGKEYSGLILDQSEVSSTCHCEPICRIACFARGAIGALSKEQVEKYCPRKYMEIKELLKEKGKKVNS